MPHGELVQDPGALERAVLPGQPLGPDGAWVELRVVLVQAGGDVGKADGERFGFPDQVVEGQGALEVLLGRGLDQGGLQGGDPRPRASSVVASLPGRRVSWYSVSVTSTQTTW